ncbi:MAG: hypothetical protein JWO78_262 [Micavibrio sp.]|nr:hypothetical protein [Micavibrio sp.]
MTGILCRYLKQKDGSNAVEAALLLPILVTMLFGVWEVGRALTANHKMITASQVVADLVARKPVLTQADLDQAIEAAVLTMLPYAGKSSDFGIDVLSVKFDSSDNPTKLWEKTYNMGTTAYSNASSADALAASKGLGVSGEGAMVVTMIYDYKPTFGSQIIPAFRMQERAFTRGRRSALVTFQ